MTSTVVSHSFAWYDYHQDYDDYPGKRQRKLAAAKQARKRSFPSTPVCGLITCGSVTVALERGRAHPEPRESSNRLYSPSEQPQPPRMIEVGATTCDPVPPSSKNPLLHKKGVISQVKSDINPPTASDQLSPRSLAEVCFGFFLRVPAARNRLALSFASDDPRCPYR